MKSVFVSSPNITHIFKALSEAFQSSVKVLANQNYRIEIPKQIGEGFIEGYEYSCGIRYINYNCQFYDDVELVFAPSLYKLLYFFYVVEGKFTTILNQNLIYKFNPYQSTILNHPSTDSFSIHFKRYIRVNINCLSIDTYTFLESRKYDADLNIHLKNLFNFTNDNMIHHCHYDLQLLEVYQNINSFEGKDFFKIIYAEGKLLELITIHLQEYLRSMEYPLPPHYLTPYEIENLKRIPDLIDNNLAKRPKIKWFAQEIGMNSNKLQKGFQELYKETVNSYIQKKRLSSSKKLLVTTNLNICEIIGELGLTSKSHFSKIFKEKYHMSPSEYRKKFKKGLN